MLASEAVVRQSEPPRPVDTFRVAAFRGDELIGWTFSYREGSFQFQMLNSGVIAKERRRGVYARLAQAVLEHATAQGYVSIESRHVRTNSAVIIAKLRLGFQVSGFEYSEVYRPLVRLKYLVGEPRRDLYNVRSRPIRAAD